MIVPTTLNTWFPFSLAFLIMNLEAVQIANLGIIFFMGILNSPKSLLPNVLRYTSCCVSNVILTSGVVLVEVSLVWVIQLISVLVAMVMTFGLSLFGSLSLISRSFAKSIGEVPSNTLVVWNQPTELV